MKELNKEDIRKNKVDTISQYHILTYLKDNLSTDEFKITLLDDENILVTDNRNDNLVFTYDKENKKVCHYEQLIEIEIEIGM